MARADRSKPVALPRRRSFTTRVLSDRTWSDFERLFAPGTGWGRCGCLFALDARRSTRGGTWAQQRESNHATMHGLVREGRSRGILVYDADRPIGWCQFVHAKNLRFSEMAASGPDWFVTCFVVDPTYRGAGITQVALGATVGSIRRLGGGVVEGHATAIASDPAPMTDSKEVHVRDDVLFWGGVARVRYGVNVDGVGPVAGLYRGRRSMHNAALGGTVQLYQRAGFHAVGVLPRKKSDLADRVIMRLAV